MLQFKIPSKPEKLLQQEGDDAVCITCDLDWDNLPDSDLVALCQSALYELRSGQGVECINNQDCLNAVFASIWLFKRLPANLRGPLVQELCAACSLLADGLPQLVASGTEATLLCNVAQELAFFCSWITEQCKATHADEEQEERSTATGKKSSKGRKPKKGSDAGWDFCLSLEQLGRAGAALMSLDFNELFSGTAQSARFVDKCTEMALAILGTPECAKQANMKAGPYSILCSVAGQPNQVQSLASALLELAVQQEHAPEVVVEAAVSIDSKCSSAGMVVALLHVFTSHEPKWFDEEAAKVPASVKQACEVMTKLAEAQPKVVAPNLSLMLEYLACNTVSVRVCIIRMLKTVLIKVFAHKDAGNEREQTSRTTSKLTCYVKLMERLKDKAALVRVEVLKTISELLSCEAVAPPALPELLKDVFERLADSTLVKKAALQTLDTLLRYAGQAWGRLDPAQLKCTLDELEAKLQAVTGTTSTQEDGSVDLAALNKEAAWDAGDVLTAGQADMDVDSMEVDGQDAEVDGATGQAGGPGTQTQTELLLQPTQTAESEQDAWGNNAVKLRHYCETVKVAVRFAGVLQSKLPLVREALNTQSADVAKEAIALVYALIELGVPGTDSLLLSMLSCMFSRDEAVSGTVVDAFYNLFIKDTNQGPEQHARKLAALMPEANLSEAASFEELMRAMCADQQSADSAGQIAPEMPSVVTALLRLSDTSFQAAMACAANTTQEGQGVTEHLQQLRSYLMVLAMTAPHMTRIVRPWLPQLLVWIKGCMVTLEDAWSVRQCCLIVKALARSIQLEGQAAAGALQDACTCMLRVMASPRLGDDGWYMAADGAMAALYALHPQPHELMQPFLLGIIKNAVPLSPAGQLQVPVSASALSRCMFLAAHCALHQLALIDNLARATRTERVLSDRLATERQERAASSQGTRNTTKQTAAEDDISTQVGGGTAIGQDAALDALKESVDAELLQEGSFLRSQGIIVSLLCQGPQQHVMQAHETLRDCLLLSMSKFMVVDRDFCDRHMDLLLNWLNFTGLDPAARASLVVSLADLATRHPNSVEPFTARLNEPLQCLDAGVRKTTLTVLSHLILNGMMKVKGHVAAMALGLVDSDNAIRDLAARFFATLAMRGTSAKAGTNPIHNTLPDMLSYLAAQTNLNLDSAKQILKALLPFVKESKQAETFKEKLCQRFACLHEAQAATAADFAAAAAAARQEQATASQQTQAADSSPPHAEQDAAAGPADSHAGPAAGTSNLSPGDDATSAGHATAPTELDNHGVKAEPIESADTGPMDTDAMDVEDAQPADTVKAEPTAAAATGPSSAERASADNTAPAGSPTAQAANRPGNTNGSSQPAPPHGSVQAPSLDAVRREQKLLTQCLMEMPYTEKGTRTIMSLLRCYKHALGDKEVFNFFWGLADHTRKRKDAKGDIKEVATRFKAEIEEVHKALRLGATDVDLDEGDQEAGEEEGGGEELGAGAEHEGEPTQDPAATEEPSSIGSMAGGRTRREAGSKTTSKAAGAKAGSKAASARNSRRKAAKSSDSDDVEEEEEQDQDEVVGPRRTAGSSRQTQRATSSRTSSRATVSKGVASQLGGASRRRKQVVSSSDEDEGSGDDVAADEDQDGDSGGEGASLGSQVQRMQKLKISGTKSTSSSQRCAGGGSKRQTATSRARRNLAAVEEDE